MKKLIRTTAQFQDILKGATQLRINIKQKIIKPIDLKYPKNEMYLDAYNRGYTWYWWTKDGRQNLSQSIKSICKKDDILQIKESFKKNSVFIKIKNVRIERLQDIGEEEINDSVFLEDSEIPKLTVMNQNTIHLKMQMKLIEKYIAFWNSAAKDGFKWKDNPFVFVYDFEIVKGL